MQPYWYGVRKRKTANRKGTDDRTILLAILVVIILFTLIN